MPSVAVKLYSVFFKFLLKHRLQNRIQAPPEESDPFGITTRPDESVAAANPSFSDGVATKDIHIDSLTSLSVRIFLPDSALASPLSGDSEGSNSPAGGYRGYSPMAGDGRRKKLPVVLQFHGGGWVSGGNDSVANDCFCRRIAKLCDAVVVAVGYRLAPENRYPAAFEDGMKVLNWLAKQANLAECSKSLGGKKLEGIEICVLLGVSCGANIANYVARKAVEAGNLLDPVKVVAQVLMYPFFIGSVPTRSEIKLANSYFYDKAMCLLAWKLFLPEEEFSLDHPAANPLVPGHGPPLKQMPPTLTVVAEHDWMRDRAIAYSEELRKAQVCAEDIAIWVKKYISLRGHEFSY
uniref:Gibberellin receptor GID1L2 n=1 Tax=Cajanus cajan TaxID=3821 RepID=A0A151SFX9_CAJCA|nr:putative gibberellin receptor GID1L2 [Cajanus cajan]